MNWIVVALASAGAFISILSMMAAFVGRAELVLDMGQDCTEEELKDHCSLHDEQMLAQYTHRVLGSSFFLALFMAILYAECML